MAISLFSAGQLITEDQLNDLVMAEQAFQLSMQDSADLFDTPAIFMPGNLTGSGSLVARHRLLTLGWGLSMDATDAEDTDVAVSNVTAADVDVTIARRALRLDETGLARSIGGSMGFEPIALGMTFADSFRAGRMGLLGTALAAASTNITSATMGSLDDLYDVIDSFTASTGDPGQLIGAFRPQTLSAIRDSMRSEVGPQQMRADVQAFLAKGAEVILGILCFPTTRITSAGGYYENAVMTAGAIAYDISMPSAPLGGNTTVMQPTDMPLLIEVERNAGKDQWKIVGNGYDGLAIREQARIRGFLGSTT